MHEHNKFIKLANPRNGDVQRPEEQRRESKCAYCNNGEVQTTYCNNVCQLMMNCYLHFRILAQMQLTDQKSDLINLDKLVRVS